MTELSDVKKLIRQYDRKMKAGSEKYNAALVLLSSTIVGPNEKALVDFTKLPKEAVAKFGKRLRAQKIWHKGKVHHSGWDDKESGGIAFGLDVYVALGWLNRR